MNHSYQPVWIHLMNILSIDFGTSSVKLSVLDERLNILDSVKVAYDIRVLNTDWVEMDAPDVFNAMIEGIRQLGEHASRIDVIAYDCFAPSMVFMDREGHPLYPLITHLDRRSKKQSQDILQVMGKERFQQITGIQPFTGGASITTAMWVKENEPEVFRKTFKVGHLVTYIYRQLTGRWITDPTNASMTGMYQTTQWSTWSDEICQTFGIPLGMLPDIELSGKIAGHLSAETASMCGLRAGIPVAVGAHDTTVAHVAAGNSMPGDVLDVSGSNEMISILTDQPIVDDRYYLRNAITPGQWQIFAITASGFAVDWFRKEFYRDLDETSFFKQELLEAIEIVPETTARFLPYLAGDRQSMQPKKGGFSGLTLASTRQDMLASILIGIHEPIVDTIRICEQTMKLNSTIKLTGGMITPEFIRIKKMLLPGYDFEIKMDCPIIANAMLALENLKRT